MKYRPWGPIGWALSLSGRKRWHFIGTLGTEERSLCSWAYLKQSRMLKGESFTQIRDIDSDKYRDRIAEKIAERRQIFAANGGDLSVIENMDLMTELFRVNALAQDLITSGPSLILDITSLPKRFFFPILKILTKSNRVKDLLLTYTTPFGYAPEDEPLYEDIEPWRILPGFGGDSKGREVWVVSVGFLVESLCMYVGGNPEERMKLLIPFPAPISALRRTWEAVANLERDYLDGRFEKFRVETLDMSAAFDRIKSIAGKPEKALSFAPFGPKPISAAMCLYAIQKDSSVHYAQPTVYHPEYSLGIRNNDPASAVNAYWIKHNGENLYAV